MNAVSSFRALLEGVDQDHLRTGRKIGTGNSVGSCSFLGLMESDADQVMDVHIEADGNTTATIEQAQLSAIFMP